MDLYKTRYRCALALCCFLLLGGPTRTNATAKQPFKGRIVGQFVACAVAGQTIYVGGAQAAGNGTHVGAFTKVTSDVSNAATGAINGSFTMTVANGDHVSGTYTGPLRFGATPGSFSWILDATITGGTGRFAKATGQFTFTAAGEAVIFNGVVYGSYTETFDGTIDY